jgi:predicted HTH transcriptional regulator
VDKDTLDLTRWLEYFTAGVAVNIKAVRDKVMGLSRDVKVFRDKGQIALSTRQVKIVEYILVNKRIVISEAAHMFGISRQAALKEMDKLEKAGVIKQAGKGRGAHYLLA